MNQEKRLEQRNRCLWLHLDVGSTEWISDRMRIEQMRMDAREAFSGHTDKARVLVSGADMTRGSLEFQLTTDVSSDRHV